MIGMRRRPRKTGARNPRRHQSNQRHSVVQRCGAERTNEEAPSLQLDWPSSLMFSGQTGAAAANKENSLVIYCDIV